MNMRAYKKYIVMMAVVWSASAAIFALAYFFIVGPQVGDKEKLMAESAKKQKLYEEALTAAQPESKQKLAEEVRNLENRLGDYVAEFEESANFTFAISRIAAEKQVGSFTVKTNDPAKDSGKNAVKSLQENRVEIAFTSDFRQFATFLNALERNQPVVFVDRFKLLRAEPSQGANKVDMDLAIFVRKRTAG